MKKNIKFILAFLSISTILMTSCTDEDKFNNPVTFDLIDGAYIRFVDQVPEKVVDAADVTQAAFVNALIEPVGADVASVVVEIAPVIAGVSMDTIVFKTFNSFPGDVSFTSQEMAAFLGLDDVTDIAGGDSFEFFTTVTLADGRVFSWKPNEFIEGDEDDGTIDSVAETGGVTDGTVITDSRGGYRQAYNYIVNFVCPFVNTDLAGTYTVSNHRFDAFFGAQPATREVVAGPAANQFTIIGGAVPLDGADDLIVNVDLVTGTVLGAENSDAIHFNTFGPGTYGQVEGLAISCAGVVDLTITSPGFISNFLTMRKN